MGGAERGDVPFAIVHLGDGVGDESEAHAEEVGVDELIVPDFTFGPMERKKASMDLFIEQVAPSFR